MIDLTTFQRVVDALQEAGYAEADIRWSETCGPPADATVFAREAIFVICNSGMKNTVAQGIYNRVRRALEQGASASTVFGHRGKTAAIDELWTHRERYLQAYLAAEDKLAYCGSLPWIGEITKYHLAKNFGLQVSKPDVHLQRLADREGCTPQDLCERLSRESGYKVATVDVLLWRACALGVIDSRTGEVRVG